MNITRLSTIIATLGLCCSMAAQANVDEILSSVAANNPDIRSVSAQLTADSIEISSSNFLEDPSVDFEYLWGKVGDKWAVGVSQGFDWPGLYAARRRANRSRLSALDYTAQAKRIEVLYQAKLLCLDLVNLNKLVAVQEDVYGHYTELYDEYSRAFEKGENTILDINKLRIEMVTVKQTLEELMVKRAEAVASLNALNGGSPINAEAIDEYPAEAFLPLDEYVAQYHEFDPTSNYYAQMDQALAADRSVARQGWLPSFSVGYKYTVEIGDVFSGVSVGASIPIFANRKQTRAAQAQQVANAYAAQSAADQSLARIKSTFQKAVSLKSRLEAYRSALDLEANHQLLRKALDGGQITLLEYIQEMIYFAEAQNQMLAIEYDYQATMAELNRYGLLK